MFICTGLILILFGKEDLIPMGESTAIIIEDVVLVSKYPKNHHSLPGE
jgi:hypothetical protein